MARNVETFLEEVPQKAKLKDPVIIWILPTLHRNYANNWEGNIFSRCLNTAGKGKKYMTLMDLRNSWDENDDNLVPKERKRISDKGLIIFLGWGGQNNPRSNYHQRAERAKYSFCERRYARSKWETQFPQTIL